MSGQKFREVRDYHPRSLYRALSDVPARLHWYYEQHKKRWERRYEQPYPEVKGEIGTFAGVRWIDGV